MKILMTGATGLIGKELGKKLLRNGHEIVIVSRDQEKANKEMPFRCEIIEGDLSKGSLFHPILESIDAVIHLLGENIASRRWSKAQKIILYESRVTGTRNLVNSFTKNIPSVFVSASAIGIYGDAGQAELPENSQPGKGFLADLCVAWEQEVDMLINKGRTRIVKFRLSPVLARQGGALKKMKPIFQSGLGGRLGSGKQWMSWVHLQDVINAFSHAIDDEKFKGIYNLSAPGVVTNEEFSKSLAHSLGRTLGPPVPAFALKILFGELANTLLASQKVKPQALMESGFKFQFPDLDRALKEIFDLRHKAID